ncbi:MULTISPECIES: flippase [unclassified Thiocapsa]|uniref:flippase n=1 Tax=unclassified Thiocapsa TaxID=2641286 RepID=UPI0035B4F5D7
MTTDSTPTTAASGTKTPRVRRLSARLSASIGSSTSLRGRLVRGGFGSLALKLGSTALGFLLAIFLARTLGPEGYGVYAFVLAIVSLLAIPTQFGLPQLVVRETAKSQAAEQWGRMRGLWRWSTLAVWLFSSLVVVLAFVGLWLFGERLNELTRSTLVFGLLLVPLIALGDLRGAALRGLRHVVAGQLPEAIFRPGLLMVFCLVVLLTAPNEPLTAATAMSLHALASAIAFALGAWLLWRARPTELTTRPTPDYAARAWTISAWPLALTAGLQVINAQSGVLLLGLFATPDAVGVYKVAVAVGMLIAFGLGAVNLVVMPYFARLYIQSDRVRLQRLVTQSSQAILALAVPVTLVFVLFGERFLTLTFGPDYAAGHTALSILAVGQLVNASMGSVGILLNMTGHERDTLRGVAIAAVANVLLGFVLIPLLGLAGAALSTAATQIIWNLLLRRAVWRRIQIETMAFGMSFQRPFR